MPYYPDIVPSKKSLLTFAPPKTASISWQWTFEPALY